MTANPPDEPSEEFVLGLAPSAEYLAWRKARRQEAGAARVSSGRIVDVKETKDFEDKILALQSMDECIEFWISHRVWLGSINEWCRNRFFTVLAGRAMMWDDIASMDAMKDFLKEAIIYRHHMRCGKLK